jgi:hypothetical protein
MFATSCRVLCLSAACLGLVAAPARAWAQGQEPKLRTTLKGHQFPVNAVAFNNDDTLLVSGSGDQTVKLWVVKTGELKATLKGHTSPLTGIAYSKDGSAIASACDDQTVRLWDGKTGAEKATLKGHTQSVNSAAFHPNGKLLASGSFDKTVRIWDLGTNKQIQTLEGHKDSINSVAFSPDGKLLASGSWDNTIKLWDASGREIKEIRVLNGHTDWLWCVAFSNDSTLLASGSGSRDMSAKIWDVKTGKEIHTLKGHTNLVNGVAFSKDGTILATGGWDGVVKFWDVKSGKEIGNIKSNGKEVTSVAFSHDDSLLAVGGFDANIRLYDVGDITRPGRRPPPGSDDKGGTGAPGDKGGKGDAKDARYYPLTLGNQWEYTLSVGGNNQTMISKIAAIDDKGGMKLARLEATLGGQVVGTEHVGHTADGYLRFYNENMELKPPVLLLKYPVKDGAKWEGEFMAGFAKEKYQCEAKLEDVEVPAGKFKAVRVDIKMLNNNAKTTYWFVQDVGMVRQTAEVGNIQLELKLEKYKVK